jgi:hypothetical protein
MELAAFAMPPEVQGNDLSAEGQEVIEPAGVFPVYLKGAAEAMDQNHRVPVTPGRILYPGISVIKRLHWALLMGCLNFFVSFERFVVNIVVAFQALMLLS